MITEKEIQAAKLSPTKKDFYQIWNELIDTAGKISERWDPSSTNESDPGIVLLKVLTACTDKLNYNIDKNILEAFMPSAAQEESMRKLCDMMGYNIKYYQSATTSALISYVGAAVDTVKTIIIPEYSTIKNSEGDITYITLKEVTLTIVPETDTTTAAKTSDTVDCIQGVHVRCETDNDNLVMLTHLDDNYRYYLPEVQIAENGIFIYNSTTGEKWQKVDNLNTQISGARVFKFGYDSKEKLPYVQFPEDINSLIGDGLEISYVRTNGVNGNISANTLTTLEYSQDNFSSEDFTAVNKSAAMNGANVETINDAYQNFKKTIGTFDTLVTCRDYINKIYSLYTDDNIPLVSNVIVSDIRDDINNSITLCSFNDYGICYLDKAITEEVTRQDKHGQSYTIDVDKINSFDLILYPFKTVYGLNTKAEYVNSFTYSKANVSDIIEALDKSKTIAHNYKLPEEKAGELSDLICIKNYLQLKAKLTTKYKVNSTEETEIISAVLSAIYARFNLRKLDFGEEIPYDDILECIETADERIKNVSLDEPVLFTKFMTADNKEYDVAATGTDATKVAAERASAKVLYNKLALRNIIAGRVPIFNYNEDFSFDYTEAYIDISGQEIKPMYGSAAEPIVQMTSKCLIKGGAENIDLAANEVVSFRAPNFKTIITYPGYVNYYIHIDEEDSRNKQAVAANFITFNAYIRTLSEIVINDNSQMTEDDITGYTGVLFKKADDYSAANKKFVQDSTGTFKINLTADTASFWFNWVKQQDAKYTIEVEGEEVYDKLKGLYRIVNSNFSNVSQKMIDSTGNKYQLIDVWRDPSGGKKSIDFYYVQNTQESDNLPEDEGSTEPYYTADGFGRDAEIYGLNKNGEYELGANDYLLINYTESSQDDSGSDNIKNIVYKGGTVIKPNFDLISSEIAAETKSYSKKTGFDFKNIPGITQPDGMFTLGTDEQIEIRDRVSIYLDERLMFVYWTLQAGSEKETGVFPFDDNGKYTLKENEYFYYTDQNKSDMAYYGNGTEIVKVGDFILRKRDLQEEIVSSEDILTNGLSVVPWTTCNFTRSDPEVSTDKYLKINEYQYINLAAGDKLVKFAIDSTEARDIDNSWQPCLSGAENTSYILSGGTETGLPVLSVSGASWAVRSKLEFNVGPDTRQTLRKVDNKIIDSITLKTYNDVSAKTGLKDIKTLEPTQAIPISIKTNYACQYNTDTVDTKITIYETDGTTVKEHIDDFKVRVFSYKDLAISEAAETATAITQNNFCKYWTKVSFNDFRAKEGETASLPLYVTVPDNSYALLMIYYLQIKAKDVNKGAYLTANNSSNICIFNYGSDTPADWTWWTGYKENNKHYLKPGINIIKVKASETLSLFADESLEDTAIISGLDIITINSEQIGTQTYSDFGVNTELLSYYNTSSTAETIDLKAKQLFKDIKTIDKDYIFYYNCLIDNSTAIDINTTATTNEEKENLASPKIWYDYNNLNNKFVISEIDASYLAGGITIAKTSKL